MPKPRKRTERPRLKLQAAIPFIDQILQGDRQAPRKQRHTAHRIWVRLGQEVPDCPVAERTVRDDEIERIAVHAVIAYEEARGWRVESVEKDNRGFDLISRRPHPEDPATAIEVRFIEVKRCAGVGEIALSTNEFKTAERLKRDFWLYAVFNCGSNPEIHIVQDPVRLGWEPIVSVEHYHVGANEILTAQP